MDEYRAGKAAGAAAFAAGARYSVEFRAAQTSQTSESYFAGWMAGWDGAAR